MDTELETTTMAEDINSLYQMPIADLQALFTATPAPDEDFEGTWVVRVTPHDVFVLVAGNEEQSVAVLRDIHGIVDDMVQYGTNESVITWALKYGIYDMLREDPLVSH